VSHSDIASSILEWFGVELPCEWVSKIQHCPDSLWPGNEKNINTHFDTFALAADSLILILTMLIILAMPFFTQWLLQ
jgi:acyl carrier protein